MSRVELPLLDLMICTACELRCIGCTNGMGMLERLEVFPVAEIKRDIDQAARLIHTEVAVLLGGEPLGHPRLIDLLAYTKASGLAERVRVLTNGLRLHKMRPAFWESLQDLKISIYPGHTPEANIALAHERQAEYGFALSFYDVAHDPFRAVLTASPRLPESAQATYERCWYRTFTRKIERGYLWRCCTSPSISQQVLGLPPDADGLRLEGATPESVQAFLDRESYINACTRCHGNAGPLLMQWAEERDREQWLSGSSFD